MPLDATQFLEHFSKKPWHLEFCIDSDSQNISKILFYSYSQSPDLHSFVSDYIWGSISYHKILDRFFGLFGKLPIHIGIDIDTQRLKLYIWLYNYEIRTSMVIVKAIQQLLWENPSWYLYEKNLVNIDCVSIDISLKWISSKVYEITPSGPHISRLNNSLIKEMGVMKNMSGRRKYFYRFIRPIEFDGFEEFQSNYFLLDDPDIAKYYRFKRKIKYYCIEEDKKEIYFI
jgi:hypothetical protein